MVHGGEVFSNNKELYSMIEERKIDPYENKKNWKNYLLEELEGSHEIFKPTFPNSWLADYNAWKIWFEKYFEFLTSKNIILIGNSLGGIFLAKYLCENTFPKKISQLHLLAPVFDHGVGDYLGNFSFDNTKLENVSKQCENIFLYHSHDDDIVPFNHSVEYKQRLEKSELIEFKNRGHFIDERPINELIERIKRN